MRSEQPKIDDGGPAFPRPMVGTDQAGMVDCGAQGMSLRDYFAANEMLSDYCTDIWDMNHEYVEAIVGRPIPENLKSREAAEYEAEFFAKMRYMRADAMLKVRQQ